MGGGVPWRRESTEQRCKGQEGHRTLAFFLCLQHSPGGVDTQRGVLNKGLGQEGMMGGTVCQSWRKGRDLSELQLRLQAPNLPQTHPKQARPRPQALLGRTQPGGD